MRKGILAFMLVGLVAVAGCSPVSSKNDDSASTDPGTDTTVDPDAALKEGSPLWFSLGMQWESDESKTYANVKTCNLPEGAAAGTAITCNITIPEAQLYYSRLKFAMGSNKVSQCPILKFQPYYYVRSTVDFTLPGATAATVCTGSTPEKACWGGAGPQMIEDWPKNFGRYFLPAVTSSASFNLESENTLRSYLGYPVNFLVTNDNPNPTNATTTFPYRSTGSGWQDYAIECVDKWGATLHRITITISDENTVDSLTGPVDHYPDWP